ncbi:nucleoside-diphosphate sugar epimerase [Amedibacterium intestinale]|jgi:capsular polysaccharide biosynthesis protein cap5D|uniref:Nucleoside-diphosphate sugar epimerase n=1 Tax=Amedibacterium intestinale TaxID=2583452 RepID=A0A6N4TM10_9FIRM|nr:nucleoside-diphosphate sugar epimerase/dehydratase [Amedibacterium intestinale]BBK23524.1 nucleoside-diphosphate sugar epimerase [Amedibacterium intestinale]
MAKLISGFTSMGFYKKYREIIMLILDLFTVFVSFFMSVWMKADFKFSYLNLHLGFEVLKSFLVVLLVFGICFYVAKIYKSLWKYTSIIEAMKIAMSNIIAALILIILSLLTLKSGSASVISIIIVAVLFNILFMLSARVLYRMYRRMQVVGNAGKKALIAGAGDAGVILLRELNQNPEIGYKTVGFLDDNKKGKIVCGIHVVGTTDEVKEMAEKYGADAVLIAMPSAPKERVREIFENCQKVNLPVKIMHELNDSLEDSLSKKQPIEDVRIEDLLGRGEIHLQQDEIQSYITGRTVCVTGAGGSIGSELCRQIVKFEPARLLMIDINENSLYMLEQEFNRSRMHHKINEKVQIVSYIASIRDKGALDELFDKEKPDVVYHAAAHKHVPLMETRPMEAVKNNVFGTYNLIRSCIEHKVKRFIMISTDKAVNPTNVMGATKRMTEMILQAYGDNGVTKMAAVRFGNVLGSNGSVIPIFKRQIAEGGPVTITDKNIIRYFMTIPEAAQLVLQAGYYADQGEIFVLDMGDPVKILDLAEKMIRLSGLRPYKDINIIEIGLRPGEKMFEELKLDGETTSKTKNNLIYKNEVMKISKKEIEEKLLRLREVLEQHSSKETIRETMLDVIIGDKTVV